MCAHLFSHTEEYCMYKNKELLQTSLTPTIKLHSNLQLTVFNYFSE